jgi:hypothetical protein
MRSQNEEDGLLLALFERAGWGRSRFVEIGSGKSGGNAAGLAHECGWSGLMIELSERSVEGARKKFAAKRGVTVVGARVTPAVTPVEAFRPLRSRTEVDDAEVMSDIYAAIARHELPLVEV